MGVSTEEKNAVNIVTNQDELQYKIEIATQTLERNIDFVTNCDNKAFIMLAAIGVLFTLILTNEGFKEISSIIDSCINAKTFLSILYLIFFMFAVFIMLVKMISCMLEAATSPNVYDVSFEVLSN